MVKVNEKNGPVLYVCSNCGKTLKSVNSLRVHLKVEHQLKLCLSKPTVKCPLCTDAFRTGQELEHHVSTVHDIPVEHSKLSFQSEEDFKAWKSNIEKETKSYYSHHRSQTKAKQKTIFYLCHRSGIYKPRVEDSARQRSMKATGSRRIGGVCPASIKAVIGQKGSVEVDYVSQHVGHECEVEKLTLSASEREILVNKLKAGMPHQRILKDLRETFDSDTRIGLITRKDLHNIKASYNIKTDVKLQQDDAKSVDLLIEKYGCEEDNPVLWYKPYGQEDSLVGKENFALLFMNKPQRELLNKYRYDILVMDSTRGSDPYKIQLTTLMVVDGDFQVFPVAFLWSVTQSEVIFQKFFDCILKKVPELKPMIFMSDDVFFNAFSKTYSYTPPHKLLCESYVKRKIRENLTKVKDLKKRNYVKKALLKLISESEEQKFTDLHETILNELLNDEDTLEYGQYFSTHFSRRPEQWAHCFSKDLHYETNISLKQWHQLIKSKGEVQRLDSSISNVLECLRLQFLRRLRSRYQNRVPPNLHEISSRHNLAEESGNHIQIFEEDSNSWYISSSPNNHQSDFLDFYQVSINKEFIDCSCCIRCDKCNVCLHAFCCTCPDYSVGYNMCKHIHLVGMQGRELVSTSDANVGPPEGHDASESYIQLLGMQSIVERSRDIETAENITIEIEENNDVQLAEDMKMEFILNNSNESSEDMSNHLVDIQGSIADAEVPRSNDGDVETRDLYHDLNESSEERETELQEKKKKLLEEMVDIVNSCKNVETVDYVLEVLSKMKSNVLVLEDLTT